MQGYITQNNRKVKFKKYNSNFEFGVYIGDDITGTAITYFMKPFSQIIKNANPYIESEDMSDKYKSDLDGKFRGLKYFPIGDLTLEEANKITNKIKEGNPL